MFDIIGWVRSWFFGDEMAALEKQLKYERELNSALKVRLSECQDQAVKDLVNNKKLMKANLASANEVYSNRMAELQQEWWSATRSDLVNIKNKKQSEKNKFIDELLVSIDSMDFKESA